MNKLNLLLPVLFTACVCQVGIDHSDPANPPPKPPEVEAPAPLQPILNPFGDLAALAPAPKVQEDPEGLMAAYLPRWTAAVGVELEDVPPFRMYSVPAPIPCGDADPEFVVGCAYSRDADGVRDVVVLESLDAAGLRSVATHEIGHLLGAGHTVGGVMNATVNLTDPSVEDVITQDAINEVCNAGLVACSVQIPEVSVDAEAEEL